MIFLTKIEKCLYIFVELCKGHNSTALIGFRCLSWGVALLVLCLYCSLKHKCTQIARFFAMIVSSLAFILTFLLQRFIKGITPNITSSRVKAPPKAAVKEMQMSESSARLLKNASFLTQNNSFNFPAENP